MAACFVPEQGDEGGAHAAQGAGFLRALEDGVVGGADGLAQAGVRDGWRDMARRRAGGLSGGFGRDAAGVGEDGMGEAVEEGFGGEMAGHFASGGASHAIADDEGAVLGQGGAGVLVGVAHTAAMGEHGEGTRASVRSGCPRRRGVEFAAWEASESQCLAFRHTRSADFGAVCNDTPWDAGVTMVSWGGQLGIV